MTIDRDGPVPPSRQIAEQLRKQIESGEIPAGRRIPSLRELCDTHEVAMITVQKAIKILKDDGLVESVPGMGVFVREVSNT